MTGAQFYQTFLPYCLVKQSDGRYVVLNRSYVPVGLTLSSGVDYAEHPVTVSIKGLTAKVAAQISVNGDGNTDRIYLYEDAVAPRSGPREIDAYMKRLQILAKLKVDAPYSA